MSKTSDVPSLTQEIPDQIEQAILHELAVRLISDIENDVIHKTYYELEARLAEFLASGYKDHEIQGELRLTDGEFRVLISKCPTDWWERNRIGSKKWIGRKRARLLTEHGGHDLTAVQTLDPEWSPKNPALSINITSSLTEEERQHVIDVFAEPKETKAVSDGKNNR